MGTALGESGVYQVHHIIRYDHGLFPAFEGGEPAPPRQLQQFLEAEANARLIEAAPDLFEACKAALEDVDDWRGLMDAAITKAEGK